MINEDLQKRIIKLHEEKMDKLVAEMITGGNLWMLEQKPEPFYYPPKPEKSFRGLGIVNMDMQA